MERDLSSALLDRRRTKRRQTVNEHGIDSVRIRRGVPVAIIDASAGGMLVETHQRLLPGMPLEIHLERHKRLSTVRGRVLRCGVVRLTASAVCYQGAIVFDQQLPWLVSAGSMGSVFTTADAQ